MSEFSGWQKAAILLMVTGPEVATQVIRYLGEDEIARITQEMATLGTPPTEAREQVVAEFERLAHGGASATGMAFVRQLLERALGPQRARELIDRVVEPAHAVPFEALRKAPAAQVASLLLDEHPQVAAVALAHLRPEQGAAILKQMPGDVAADLAQRIARARHVSPELMRRIEHSLERRLLLVAPSAPGARPAGGVKVVADLIARVDRETEKDVLGRLEALDPQLAEEVKSLLFTFEDLATLDEASLQRVLREVDQKVLATALKGAPQEIREKVFANVSTRVAEVVKEQMEVMGPVRLREVEEARRAIVAAVRALEESGEIVITREEEMVVS